MMDVIHEINSVRRQAGTRTLEAGEARTLTITRSYNAAVEDVWDACTNAERIPRWFLPISGDLREGGRYQLEGQAGGTIQRCAPPRSFAATWEFGGEVTWIELRLAPSGEGRTLLELEHTAHVDNERWLQYGPGAVGVGWELLMLGLARHLESGQAVDPHEAQAWSMSEEGLRFMTLSSHAWGEASIADGTEAVVARAAADRTTAFYTGQPEPSSVS